MKIKVISILLCFVLIITAFAGCKKNEEETTTTTTTTTTTETTTETITEESYNNTSSNKKVQRDSRLVGKWRASTKIVVGENGETVTSKCNINFRKDGTFSQITTENQARQMIIDTYLITFGCANEQELDEYLRQNKKIPLDAFVAMALAEMTDTDFRLDGEWRTENKNTLYETTNNGQRDVTETMKYTVSDDGNTVKISVSDASGGTQTMILTRA